MPSEPRWLSLEEVVELNRDLVAALMFLELNGWSLARSLDSEALGEAIVSVIDGGMSEEDFVALLAPHVALHRAV